MKHSGNSIVHEISGKYTSVTDNKAVIHKDSFVILNVTGEKPDHDLTASEDNPALQAMMESLSVWTFLSPVL